jgi:hypothetical protein
MADAPPTRRLWRIARTDPPTRDDFVSRAARGEPSPDDPEATRLWDGLSVYDTQAQARRTARRYRGLGAFLAAVDVPLDGRCRIERTLHRAGHHTVWGDADLLHAAVARVVSVAADEGSE